MKWRVAAIVAVAVVVLGVVWAITQRASPPQREAVIVRVGYTPLIYAQPTFVAIEKDYFAEVGIKVKVERFENSTQIMNAVIADRLDFCAITPVLSVFAAQEKMPNDQPQFKLFYYNLDSSDKPISFLIVKNGSDIKSLADLKGKTIGVFPGNILSRTSARLLLKDLMDPQRDITFQDVGPQLQAQALETGQIDAMFTLEPYATIVLEKGVGEILYVAPQLSISDPLPGGAGVMSAKFVQQNPQTAKKFDAALYKAIEYMRSDELFAKQILPKYTPLTADLAPKVRQPAYQSAREMPWELLQTEYDVLLSEGVLTKKMDVRSLIYRPN